MENFQHFLTAHGLVPYGINHNKGDLILSIKIGSRNLTVILSVFAVMVAVIIFRPASCLAENVKFVCTGNSDFVTNSCRINVNAVTQTINGISVKGHLLHTNSGFYTCMKNVCTENYKGIKVAFGFPMNDLKGFCTLLSNKPACLGQWVRK
jgi:hypothetical protein